MSMSTANSLPRQLIQCCACCPTAAATYAAMHLDTIGKILNHVLVTAVLCDIFLFLSSFGVSVLPTMGLNTVIISFLLASQAVCVWLIINNNRISALSFLSPTDFMIGVALGITIGATILSFVLWTAFRHVTACDAYGGVGPVTNSTSSSSSSATQQQQPLWDYVCGEHRGSLNAIWFWSGITLWLNLCTSLLLAVGRQELSQYSLYNSLGPSMDDYENHFRNPTQFVGDYATVPEIRTAMESADAASAATRSSHGSLPNEKARISSV